MPFHDLIIANAGIVAALTMPFHLTSSINKITQGSAPNVTGRKSSKNQAGDKNFATRYVITAVQYGRALF
jgi:hypothetical protein